VPQPRLTTSTTRVSNVENAILGTIQQFQLIPRRFYAIYGVNNILALEGRLKNALPDPGTSAIIRITWSNDRSNGRSNGRKKRLIPGFKTNF
jgi:hypothetical protein